MSDLVGNPDCWFSRANAQIMSVSHFVGIFGRQVGVSGELMFLAVKGTVLMGDVVLKIFARNVAMTLFHQY